MPARKRLPEVNEAREAVLAAEAALARIDLRGLQFPSERYQHKAVRAHLLHVRKALTKL